jgi:tetrapyrrole methylase family protein/MazG family protein
MSTPSITLLGLGPGDPALLTRQAWELLNSIPEIHLRTRQHPAVAGFPPGLRVHSFDRLYEDGESFSEVYEQIVAQVLQLAARPQGVVYAVPGHPFVAEATSPEIARRAREQGIPCQVVEGLSFLEATFAALGIDPFPHTALVDALELAAAHHPPFPPSAPVVIAQIHSPAVASEVKLVLMALYPDDHPVQLVHSAGTPDVLVENLRLYEIDRSPQAGLLTSLYVPPLGENTSFEAFQEIVAHLRAPEGCPWDREQTHQSLRPHLLEETYEVLTALDADDPAALREELGDLLLQIVLHAQIAGEYGEFNMSGVLQGIHAKLVHRHPHVFGELRIADSQGVIENWERLKAAERKASGKETASTLDGVALALPALSQAEAYQKRVARVGFDWPNLQGVLDKISEELEEVRQAPAPPERAQELGDLLFAVVNLARWFDVDAESALREANARFRRRFGKIESAARSQGRPVSDLTLEEMDALWEAAKESE